MPTQENKTANSHHRGHAPAPPNTTPREGESHGRPAQTWMRKDQGPQPLTQQEPRPPRPSPPPPNNDQQGQKPRSPLETPTRERQKEHSKRHGIAGLSPPNNYTPQYTPPWTTPPNTIPPQQTVPTTIPPSPPTKPEQNIQNHQEPLTHTT